MLRNIKLLWLVVCTVSLFTNAYAAPAAGSFTVVVLPDTQKETASYPENKMWMDMVEWISANASTRNIKAVVGVGDITDGHSKAEFEAARKGFDSIDDAGVPYAPTIGNHDYDDVANRIAASYDAYFGPISFQGKTWYGGGFPEKSNQNFCIKFDAGAHKYLVLALELYPRTVTLKWAQAVISANTDREVIVATHAYLRSDGTRELDSTPDNHGPIDCGLTDYNSGQGMWDSFIKLNKNIIMTLNGHFVDPPTTARLAGDGTNGNIIQQIFVNYQHQNCGDGYMMLLEFHPEAKSVEVSFYSAFLKKYDPNNPSYELKYGNVKQAAAR